MAKDVIARLKADTSQWDGNIQKAKKSLDGMGKSTSSMDQLLKSGMGTLAKYAAAWITVEGAVKAFNKIVAGSQTTTDAWGRTMAATTRVTEGFFESISRGNFSNFINGLQDVIRNAREAYDAMDRLSTHNAFHSERLAEIENRRARLRVAIREGKDVDTNKQALRDLQIEEQNYLQETAMEYRSAATAQLTQLTQSRAGADWVMPYFRQGKSGQDAAMKEYQRLLAQHSTVHTWEDTGSFSIAGAQSGATRSHREWSDKDIEAKANALLNYAQLSDEQLTEISNMYAQAELAEASYWRKRMEDRETLNYKAPGGGSLKTTSFDLTDIQNAYGTTTSMAELKQRQAQAMAAIEQATTAEAYQAAQTILEHIQSLIEAQPIALRLSVSEEDIANVMTQTTELGERIRNDIKPVDTSTLFMGQDALPDVDKSVTSIGEHLQQTTQAFGTMGAAMQQLDDPSAQVAGLVMQAIANVAASFAQALASEKNIWTWMAAAIGGSATMISTIAAIKSATAGTYAEGGMIRGGSFAGDAVPIMANAGEVVLNAAQQQNVATQLQPRDTAADRQPYLSGEMMYLGLSNYLRRSGKGELTTSRR